MLGGVGGWWGAGEELVLREVRRLGLVSWGWSSALCGDLVVL